MQNTPKIRPTQNPPRNPQQPGVAITSRRRATKHVALVSTCSPSPIDPGLAEKIGLSQLSQSVKTANVTHTHTDTQTDTDGQTDQLKNVTLYAPRY